MLPWILFPPRSTASLGIQGPQETTPLLWDVAWWYFMQVCGIFPVKSHKNIEIAEHGNAILRSFRLRIAPNKKTRQEAWYLNDTFPTFPKAGRSIQTDLQPNMFRRLNGACTETSRQRHRRLERASTPPETVVCVAIIARHSTTHICPQMPQTRAKTWQFLGVKFAVPASLICRPR